MSLDSLYLFNAVPKKNGFKGNYQIIPEYGVLVTDEASYDLVNIKKFLKQTGVGLSEMNSTFWASWQKISRMSDFEMFVDQILHYFSTYGLESLGVDSVREGLVYVPNKEVKLPENIALKLIQAISSDEMIGRCFKLLNSGIALKQETVERIINVLGECNYEISGNEEIANKEAQIYFYQASGKLPTESDRLFRYLVYYFSGSTMVINDQKTKDSIKVSGKILPYLDTQRMVSLSQTFNRHKDLWMAIKSANRKNGPTVNRITKLSKAHHKPMAENPLNQLTSKSLLNSVVIKAAQNATFFQLVRAYNALALRMENPSGSVYRIRNGKAWTELEPKFMPNKFYHYADILLKEMRNRISGAKVYYEDFVDFAIPTSEKMFVGNIPEGTVLRFPKDSTTLLVGIHWEDPQTDLDLRADSSSFSLGWNTNLRNSYHTIMHSGDMTRAPKPYGASEYIYFKELPRTFNLKVNLFTGYDFSKKFKFIIGRTNHSSISKGYIIQPEEVLCSYVVPMEEKQISLGMAFSEKENNCILIGAELTGKGMVGRYSKFDTVRQEVAAKKIQTSLRLSDIVPSVGFPEDADVDLSLDKLTKDSFLGLLK